MTKIRSFSPNMQFEAAEDISITPSNGNLTKINQPDFDRFPVTHAHLANGKTIPLLKTMQTSVCEMDCNYCFFRSGRDIPRASLSPDELANAIVQISRAGIAKGVFLSSGIIGGGVRTQDKIVATAEILREKHQYQGYIHLKIMPGAEEEQIFRAMQLADRVSINLEAPNAACLEKLAPHKVSFNKLLEPLRIINKIRQSFPAQTAWKNFWPSSCTQFVVGAVGETDLELLQTTAELQSQFNISRAYYSGFAPVINTPFENLPPINIWRKTRLYQAFFLLRDYKFNVQELQFNSTGNLSLEKDPKLRWAEENLLNNPVEINQANFQQLLKIPGIGPATAKKIILKRTYGKIRDINTLRKFGVPIARASRFLLLDGTQPAYQPDLFSWNPKN